jgi:two-component system chemotaxis response regulator CheY
MSPPAAAPARVPKSLTGTRILVLDDEDNMRAIIRTVLGQCGFTDILQANSGRAALDLFAANPVDLVMCDWMMEPMNGFDFLTELRKTAKGEQVPVVMLTGNSEPAAALAAEHLNIAAWLVKPVAPKQMVARICSVLSLPTQLFSVEDDLNVDLTGLASQYRAKLSNEITELHQLVAGFEQQPKHSIVQHWSSMVRVFHTVKGQAGTFGYDLITTLGGVGQDLLRVTDGNVDVLIKFQAPIQRSLSVAVAAMSLVLRNDIKGDAGKLGERLLGKINEAAVPLQKMIEAELKNEKKT